MLGAIPYDCLTRVASQVIAKLGEVHAVTPGGHIKQSVIFPVGSS